MDLGSGACLCVMGYADRSSRYPPVRELRPAPPWPLGTSEIDNGSVPRRPSCSARASWSESAELAIDQSQWDLVGLVGWRRVHLGIRE
jgi:hypothetical protein